jgi:hypothetical protein
VIERAIKENALKKLALVARLRVGVFSRRLLRKRKLRGWLKKRSE